MIEKVKNIVRKKVFISGYDFKFNPLYIEKKANTLQNKSSERRSIETEYSYLDGVYFSKYLEYGVYVYVVDENEKWTRINSNQKEIVGNHRFVIIFEPNSFLDIDMAHICSNKTEINKFNVVAKNSKKDVYGPTISVVTASYNSVEYLDDFFSSFINTKYKNLEIIFVDDGSTDETREKVESYKQYLNINYIYQENTRQAAARNNGLQYVTSEWVCFIDSDDFIDENFFENMASSISQNPECHVFAANLIFFYESQNKFSDSHPLRKRFDKHTLFTKVDLIKAETVFHLHAGSTLFRTSIIKKENIEFPRIPIFEDAHFLNNYIRLCDNDYIVFVKGAKFFYRKREAGTSTLDRMVYDTSIYVDVLQSGYLSLMNLFGENVPTYIQNLIIYDMHWRYNELEQKNIHLNINDRNMREIYLQEIFDKIDIDILDGKNNLANFSFIEKIGLNNRYYNGQKKELRAGAYHSYGTPEYTKYMLISSENRWSFTHNGKPIKLDREDIAFKHEYRNGKYFLTKYYVKLPRWGVEIFFDGRTVPIFHNKKTHNKEWLNKNSTCLFFDSLMRANDNAEALYEFFKDEMPEFKNIYFVLSEESKDYSRLLDKGFNMISYGSEEFNKLYVDANFIFTSDVIEEIENYKNLRHSINSSTCARLIFLQHGVISDDLSKWLARKKIDNIVTSCNFEYENLTSKYHYFKNEVLLTGLPRFDLLEKKESNFFTIMYTWRLPFDKYNEEEFEQSKYYQDIIRIINSTEINNRLTKNKMEIHLILHYKMNRFLHLFTQFNNVNIKIMDINEVSFVDEISNSRMIVTDYSSIHFDFGYLDKKVLLYQENAEEFFASHTYQKEENYDYERDGLGKVVYTVNNLEDEIISAIENNYMNETIYIDRNRKAFAHQDKKNRERLIAAISDNSEKLSFNINLQEKTETYIKKFDALHVSDRIKNLEFSLLDIEIKKNLENFEKNINQLYVYLYDTGSFYELFEYHKNINIDEVLSNTTSTFQYDEIVNITKFIENGEKNIQVYELYNNLDYASLVTSAKGVKEPIEIVYLMKLIMCKFNSTYVEFTKIIENVVNNKLHPLQQKYIFCMVFDYMHENDVEFLKLPTNQYYSHYEKMMKLLINGSYPYYESGIKKYIKKWYSLNNITLPAEKPKIAVCFSGPFRGDYTKILLKFKKNLIDVIDADVYITTWENVQLYPGLAGRSSGNSNWVEQRFSLYKGLVPEEISTVEKFEKILPRTYKKFFEAYNKPFNEEQILDIFPNAKINILNEQEFEAFCEGKNFLRRGHLNQAKMFYGINECFKMLDKKYTHVIRLRPDTVTPNKVDLDKLLTIKEGEIGLEWQSICGPIDAAFFAKYNTYNEVVSCWEAATINDDLSPLVINNKRINTDSHKLLSSWLIHKKIYPNPYCSIHTTPKDAHENYLIPDFKGELRQDILEYSGDGRMIIEFFEEFKKYYNVEMG